MHFHHAFCHHAQSILHQLIHILLLKSESKLQCLMNWTWIGYISYGTFGISLIYSASLEGCPKLSPSKVSSFLESERNAINKNMFTYHFFRFQIKLVQLSQ
jgi:hypothetical protein